MPPLNPAPSGDHSLTLQEPVTPSFFAGGSDAQAGMGTAWLKTPEKTRVQIGSGAQQVRGRCTSRGFSVSDQGDRLDPGHQPVSVSIAKLQS